VTAEVFAALHAAGVPAIVLKGASVARWLYDDTPRYSSDVDLVVAPASLEAAEAVLRSLAFQPSHGDEHARDWARERDGMVVDLHETIVGVHVDPEVLWAELTSESERMELAGEEIAVLNPPARALHLALHAAQHGVGVSTALEDLERALARLAAERWGEAAGLAERLRAVPAFAAGLRLVPAGRAVADRLGLPVEISPEIALRTRTPPPVALGLYELATAQGFRAKARLLARELAPPAAFMRGRFGFARTRAGLVAAYAWRPLWLAWHAAPALRAWQRARHESRASRP
jgi:Uncharacterised nucleotidyltransferase